MQSSPALARLVTTGEWIRIRRCRLGFTLAQVSDKTGLSISHISRIEGGAHSPGLDTLTKIADALGVDVADLVSQENR